MYSYLKGERLRDSLEIYVVHKNDPNNYIKHLIGLDNTSCDTYDSLNINWSQEDDGSQQEDLSMKRATSRQHVTLSNVVEEFIPETIPELSELSLNDEENEQYNRERIISIEHKVMLKLRQESYFRYLSVAECAKYVVDDVLQKAAEKLGKAMDQSSDQILLDEEMKLWPTVVEFTIRKGVDAIEDYLMYTCHLREDWCYQIMYEGTNSDCVCDHHFYEVTFSLPTKLYPVAQATASMFFQIEVSRTLPPDSPVTVTLRMEGHSFKFKAFDYMLNDQMLLRIIRAKLNIFRRMKF